MRRDDVSPDRRQYLVKLPDYPHCWSMIPPATPRRLPSSMALNAQQQKAHEALGALRAAAATLPNADLITRTLSRREAVQSSQIEGTQTRIPDLFEYEATQGEDGKGPDTSEVDRYVQALEVGMQSLQVRKGRKALTLSLVKRIHAVLMAGAPKEAQPGRFRSSQAWIGSGRLEDATFVPPPASAVQGCMKELETSMLQYAAADEEQISISVLTQMALAHAQFETIHPFADGNGRVGRLLLPLMLAAEGYPPLYLSGYLLRFRRAYYDALAGVQLQGKWEAWGLLFFETVIQSANASMAIAADLNRIHDGWVSALSDLKVSAAARRFPRLLLGHPVVTAKQAATLLDVSFVTANNAIKLLVERGILAEPKGKRNRVFYASRILDRLEQP